MTDNADPGIEGLVGQFTRLSSDDASSLSGYGVPSMSREQSGERGCVLEEGPQTNLIINYIPATMTEEELRQLFSSIGPLRSCKIMTDKWTGLGLGYGFVEYHSPEDAERAMATLSGYRVQNKMLKVSVARPSSASITNANLYVKGLPTHVSADELRKLFVPYGDIISVRVLPSTTGTGPCRGIGFVRFDKRKEAEEALSHLHGTIPSGFTSPIHIKFADQRPSRSADPMPVLHSPPPGAGDPRAVRSPSGLSPLFSVPPFSFVQAAYPQPVGSPPSWPPMSPISPLFVATAEPHSVPAPTGGFCLFVFNIPPRCDENLLFRLFSQFGSVTKVNIARAAAADVRGYAFVTMLNYGEALSAVSHLNNSQFGNYVIQVSFKTSKPKRDGFARSASSP